MNRIFKIVYNHLMGRHVVVSEVASSIQRGTSRLVASVFMALAGLGISSIAVAADMGYSWDLGTAFSTAEGGQMSVKAIRVDWYDPSRGHTYRGDYDRKGIEAKIEEYKNQGLLTQEDYDVMMATIELAETGGHPGGSYNPDDGDSYRYTISESEAKSEVVNVIYNESLKKIDQKLQAGANAYISIEGYQKVQLKNADGTPRTDGQGNPVYGYMGIDGNPLKYNNQEIGYLEDFNQLPDAQKQVVVADGLVSDYRISAADTKMTADGYATEQDSPETRSYTITQIPAKLDANGSATLDENGKIAYDEPVIYTITDTDTTYSQEVEAGTDYGTAAASGGSTKLVASDEEETVAATITAGTNVKITGDAETGAVISAKDTSYDVTVADDTVTTDNVIKTLTIQEKVDGENQGDAKTFTDTDTTYTLGGGAGTAENTAVVTLKDQGGASAGSVTFKGDGNVTVSSTGGNEITISADFENVDTTYSQDVESGTAYGSAAASGGSTKLVASDEAKTVAATITAGTNIKITGDAQTGAVISAKDTTYEHTVTVDTNPNDNLVSTLTIQEKVDGKAVGEAKTFTDTDTTYSFEKSEDGKTIIVTNNISDTVVAELTDNDTQYEGKTAFDEEAAKGESGNFGKGEVKFGIYPTTEAQPEELPARAEASVKAVSLRDAANGTNDDAGNDDAGTAGESGSTASGDELVLKAGENISISKDGDKALITAKDTTYTLEAEQSEDKGEGTEATVTLTNNLDEKDVQTVTLIDTNTHTSVKSGDDYVVVEKTAEAKAGSGPEYTITINQDEIGKLAGSSEFIGDEGSAKPEDGKLTIKGGADPKKLSEGNIGVVGDGNSTLEVKLAKDIKDVDSIQVNKSVTVGNTTVNNEGVTIKGGPSITKTNIDMGGQQVHNVAAGEADTDAVNVSQLRQYESGINANIDHLNDRIGDVAKDANAGIAMVLAAASLPQAVLPGKSMFAVAGGTYRGEQGYAVGFSTITDNGKWIIKADASGNSRSHYGASVSVGYLW